MLCFGVDLKDTWQNIKCNPPKYAALKKVYSCHYATPATISCGTSALLDTASSSSSGLSGLLKYVVGKGLNKQMQASNWENRPLSDAQCTYAAIDAYCLLTIWNSFSLINSHIEVDQFTSVNHNVIIDVL